MEAHPNPDSGAGAIAFRLRVGVTGHRRIPNDPRLGDRVREALDRIRLIAPSSEHTRTRLTVVSPLAEGADRLVAHEALNEPDAALEAALPLAEDDYRTDFETDESKREFDELLGRAELVSVPNGARTRREAYKRVGRYVVDYCDAMIALWDGQPSHGGGGTADIVAYARRRRRTLLWMKTVPPYDLMEELHEEAFSAPFVELDRYNGAPADPTELRNRALRYSEALLEQATSERIGLNRDVVETSCAWILPHYARADTLADRWRTRYRLLGTILFLSAAAAVAVVAAQVLFAPDHLWLGLFEVAFLLAALTALFLGRKWSAHERYISYRFLAERFRSSLFLALAGVESERRRSSADDRPGEVGAASTGWLDRAYGEVWARRPHLALSEQITGGLKRSISSALIDDQLKYHETAVRRNRRRHRTLTIMSYLLFAATLVSAVLHTAGVGPESHEGFNATTALIFLAIALPAVASAVGGIHAQRQYERHLERSTHMAERLRAAGMKLESASDRAEVAKATRAAEAVLLDENRDWLVTMRFEGLRLTA